MLGQRQPAESHRDARRQNGEVEPPPREQAQAARNPQNLDDTHGLLRSEEHTSELQSLMRISYGVLCLKKHNYKYTLHIIMIINKHTPTTPVYVITSIHKL